LKAKIRSQNTRNTLSVADCLQLISIVDAVEALEVFKKVPDEFSGFTFLGSDDRWLYLKSGNPNFCENCFGPLIGSSVAPGLVFGEGPT
jgi:hypothetical protein